jgi:hypothetical protein
MFSYMTDRQTDVQTDRQTDRQTDVRRYAYALALVLCVRQLDQDIDACVSITHKATYQFIVCV